MLLGKSRGKYRGVLLAVCSATLALSGYSLAAAEDEEDEEGEEEVEEMIVTGSYIRRDNFDLPSPMSVIDEVDLELAGTSDLGDIMFDQTFQTGVNANATPFEGSGADDQQWNQGTEVWANLRGLGSRATMTMMDGHRLPADTNTWGRRAGVDVTNTYPGIAIGRVETILDGASALYGSEAVGGVINLIPRKNFEGLELQMDWNQALEAGAPNRGLSLLAGAQGDRSSLIFAMELRDVEQMRYTDRPDYIISAKDPWLNQVFTPWWHDAGSRSTPGDYMVPIRGESGELLASTDSWRANESGTTDRSIGNAVDGRLQTVRRADPGCGYGFGAGHNEWGTPTTGGGFAGPGTSPPENTYNDLSKHGNFLNGMLHAHSRVWRGEDCIMSVSDMQDLQAESEQKKGMAYFEHEFNDYVKFRGEIVVASLDYYTRDVTAGLDEWDNTSLYGPNAPIVIGSNPGNPFRAFADGSSILGYSGPNTPNRLDWTDTNGNGRYDYGIEPGEGMVFAQDADGDGIPDRDFDGDGVADNGAQRLPAAKAVLVTMEDLNGNGIPDRFDPDGGGVRLFEDVWVAGSNQLNVNPKNPRNNTIEWLDDDGILTYRRRAQRDNLRLRLGGEFSIPETEWIVDADWIWAVGDRTRQYPEPQWTETVAALRCQAGPTADSCWNPFTTTYLNTDADGQLVGDPYVNFPDDDDPGWRPPDAKEVNTEIENRNAGIILAYNKQDLSMQVVDLVASNGSLFNLWYNDAPVGMAVGAHWRLETEEWRPSVPNQTALGGGKIGLRESEQESQAVFLEFQLPLIQHPRWGEMDLQIAARYADIETRGIIGQRGKVSFDTVIPKVAMRYAPTDWLAVRASLTEGYVTPGLFSLFGEPNTTTNTATIRDYLCDGLPELSHCEGDVNGDVTGVLTGDSPSSDLGAETSDLWNAGISLRLLDGSLVFDADFTTVDFNGRADRIGGSGHVSLNEIGFEDFVLGRCPGTQFDYDSPPSLNLGQLPTAPPPSFTPINTQDYLATTPQEELDCRLNAAFDWVASEANDGDGERPLGVARLERGGGDNGLGLTLVENPWLAQGEKTTETMIYALRYSFDAVDIPWIGGEYGNFTFLMSATQYLKQSITRWKAASLNPRSGIEIDGVGNRNATSFVGPGEALYAPLPPTPEWRVNAGLRWFFEQHTLQVSGRWHDSVTNLNIAWDEQRERKLLSESEAALEESERCSWQPSPVCGFDSRHYWDVSYTYSRPNFFGFGYARLNVAIRNIFDTYPDPQTTPAGHEGYLDNIMGRMGFARLSLGF